MLLLTLTSQMHGTKHVSLDCPLTSPLKIHCPYHREASPSCVLRPEHGLFYCFGCETGGKVTVEETEDTWSC